MLIFTGNRVALDFPLLEDDAAVVAVDAVDALEVVSSHRERSAHRGREIGCLGVEPVRREHVQVADAVAASRRREHDARTELQGQAVAFDAKAGERELRIKTLDPGFSRLFGPGGPNARVLLVVICVNGVEELSIAFGSVEVLFELGQYGIADRRRQAQPVEFKCRGQRCFLDLGDHVLCFHEVPF